MTDYPLYPSKISQSAIGEKMKYIIRKLSEDFIFDELEQVRKQFVDSLTYTMESANIIFDTNAADPLDIYISYDFQQKHGEDVIYGFNFREEIARNFSLEKDSSHSSKQLLGISKSLRELADEIDLRYDPQPKKTLADIKEKQDKKDTEYAKKINQSYREVLKEAKATDEALQKKRALTELRNSKKFLDAEYQLYTSQDHIPLSTDESND